MAESYTTFDAYSAGTPSSGMSLTDLGRYVWDFLNQTPPRLASMEDRSPQDRPVVQTPIDAFAQGAGRALASAGYSLATLPQRAIEASQHYLDTGDYDPGPSLEAATTATTGGMPFAVRGALGSAGGRLGKAGPDLPPAARRRVREMGYSNDRFYRGERSGVTPQEFPHGAYFSRDYDVAEGFAKVGGRNAPEEYRLNLQKAFRDHAPVKAEAYARLVGAARSTDPRLANDMVQQIALPAEASNGSWISPGICRR